MSGDLTLVFEKALVIVDLPWLIDVRALVDRALAELIEDYFSDWP